MVALTNFHVEDQFSNEVNWELFQKTPIVLVMGGKDAAKEAVNWGKYLSETYNPEYQPKANHLQSLSPKENVKVVAVVSLPSVPGIFKGLFRSGFRKESAGLGLALDFGSELSKAFGYSDEEEVPALAFLKGIEANAKQVEIIRGISSDTEVQKTVEAKLKALKNQGAVPDQT